MISYPFFVKKFCQKIKCLFNKFYAYQNFISLQTDFHGKILGARLLKHSAENLDVIIILFYFHYYFVICRLLNC